ncbi:MAG: 3-hydroxyacyl-CoA dehydrogenase family protein [bacterium]
MDDRRREIVERILTAAAAEAKRLAGEGVASEEDVDTAMRLGALFKKPPFEYIREIGGEDAFAERLKGYAAKYGGRFKI